MRAMAHLDNDWSPSLELRATQKELREAQEWLCAVTGNGHLREKTGEEDHGLKSPRSAPPPSPQTPHNKRPGRACMPEPPADRTPAPTPSANRERVEWVT